jgi:Flp pilus assembly protein TadD
MFHHLHHYCWGLMNLNRGAILARDDRTRRFYFSEAVREFDYVIERAPTDFALLPEILTRKGEALIRLGQGPQAVPHLQQAAQLKRDYWPAYAALSDYYRSQGEIERAKDTLRTGLSFAGNVRALTRRLEELEAAAPAKKPSRKQ